MSELLELLSTEVLVPSSRARERRESRDRTLPTFEPTPFGTQHGRLGAGTHVIRHAASVGKAEQSPCRAHVASVTSGVIRRFGEQDRVGRRPLLLAEGNGRVEMLTSQFDLTAVDRSLVQNEPCED